MSDVVLSAGVRQNLLALQSTARLMSITQNRLATGKKVNTALDNPINFFTASSLKSRASDLGALLDSMSNGIKTLEAADNGIKAIKNTIESMQATLRQARQDKSFQSTSYTVDPTAIGVVTAKNISLSGGAVGATPVNIALNTPDTTPATAGKFSATNNFAPTTITDAADSITFDISVDGGAVVPITINQTTLAAVGNGDAVLDTVAEFNAILTNAGVTNATASLVGGKLTITSNSFGATSAVAISNYVKTDANANTTDNTSINAGASTAGTAGSGDGSVKTVDQLVTALNTNASLTGKIRASNDNGKLRIENLSTADLTVAGVDVNGAVNGGVATATIAGNAVRRNLVNQYNELRDQLDKLSDDSSFNGVNLLRGDKLTLTFNETGTSSIVIQAKDLNNNPTAINSATLNINVAVNADFSSDASIDTRLDELNVSLGTLRSQASNFGSNLFIVQNRTEFTKSMINTLQTGADTLVLADVNEEGANMLALQTRQQLSTTALSLSAQADQAVLRLFG
jgi:flagellin